MKLAIALVAVVVGVLAILFTEPQIDLSQPVDVTDPTCDLKEAKAPRLAGWPLQLAARLVRVPIVGSLVQRQLLNDNGLHEVRQFAASLPDDPVYYPIVAPSKEQLSLAEGAINTVTHKNDMVAKYLEAFRSGAANPVQVVKDILQLIRRDDNESLPLRAFTGMTEEALLLQAAQESADRWAKGAPLSEFDGVPVAVKDEFDVRGMPTTKGTNFLHLATPTPTEDCLPVARLRALGALIIGKTNMHEIGIGTTGYNPHYGAPRNPFNVRHYPGGSSSGSAIAVATGLVPLAVGGDGGGSIRIPAALCGVVGLKPTFQRVPCANNLDWSVGHVGPIAADVASCARMYIAMAGPSKDYPMSLAQPRPHLQGFSDIQDLTGIRIGVFWDMFKLASDEVNLHNREMLRKFESRGAKLVNVTFPHLDILQKSHTVTILSEMGTAMDPFYQQYQHRFGADTQIILALARAISARDLFAAEKAKAFFMKQTAKMFEQIDVFATPATAIIAPEMPEDAVEGGESNLVTLVRLLRYAVFANLMGAPSITFPVGQSPSSSSSSASSAAASSSSTSSSPSSSSSSLLPVGENLPVAMMLTAKWWDEHVLLRMAHAAEHLREPLQPPQRQLRPKLGAQ